MRTCEKISICFLKSGSGQEPAAGVLCARSRNPGAEALWEQKELQILGHTARAEKISIPFCLAWT